MLPRSQHQRLTRPLRPQSRRYLWLIGALDIVAYMLLSTAFATCGSALTSVVFAAASQICNAAASVGVQKRQLLPRQLLAVVVVTAGLIIRAIPLLEAAPGEGQEPALLLSAQETLGVGAMVLSAAFYAALGVCYERLMALEGPDASHAQIARTISLVGASTMTCYQLAYTLPRWQELVAGPMQRSTSPVASTLALLVALGGGFTVHTNITSRVIQRNGALVVSLINAFRSAVLGVISHALFCTPEKPLQCLTPDSALSAAVVTLGVLCWSVPGDAFRHLHKKAEQSGAEPEPALQKEHGE